MSECFYYTFSRFAAVSCPRGLDVLTPGIWVISAIPGSPVTCTLTRHPPWCLVSSFPSLHLPSGCFHVTSQAWKDREHEAQGSGLWCLTLQQGEGNTGSLGLFLFWASPSLGIACLIYFLYCRAKSLLLLEVISFEQLESCLFPLSLSSQPGKAEVRHWNGKGEGFLVWIIFCLRPLTSFPAFQPASLEINVTIGYCLLTVFLLYFFLKGRWV